LNTELHIPDGSVIKYLRLYYNDTSATGNVAAYLTRYGAGTSTSDLVSVSSSGSSGVGTVLSVEITHTVSNAAYAYTLIGWPGAATSQLQICGIRVAYYAPLPEVQFASAGQTVSETAGTVPITVTLSAMSGMTVTVPFTPAGTAIAGVHYAVLGQTQLHFGPGQQTVALPVTLLDDTRDGPDVTLMLTLGPPSQATLGVPATHALTIADNDPPPNVHFAAAAWSTGEASGSGVVTVSLTAASAFTVTVAYTASAGTAGAGDFTPVASTLVFAPGQTARAFSVPIMDDNEPEADETVLLGLWQPLLATLGAPSEAVLTILDDDFRAYMPLLHR